MSAHKVIQIRTKRRKLRVKNSLLSRGTKPRVSVFRSLKQIYAQIIDDAQGHTVASFSSKSIKDVKASKKEIAKRVGLELGKLAKNKNVSEVFFDRGSFAYHGRIASLAEGLREIGLKF